MKKSTEKQIKNPKKMRGVVVSTKNAKTLVVEVKRLVMHPVYKKRYNISKNYKVHYESGEYKEGETINFQETKPISKNKCWAVIEK